MVNTKLEAQRKTVLHYWLNGTRSPIEIHKKTRIPLRTIENNLKKIKKTGTVEHKRGNGRPSKVTQAIAVTVGQAIRRNTAVSTRQIAVKVQKTQGVKVSHQTIWRNLKKKGYRRSLPLATPMLTERHIEARKEWAKEHMGDNWRNTIFTDETAFDLFRNKVRRWHKDGQKPVRRLPKSRQKVMAWGGISLKGKTPLFCFTEIMDGPFYVNILQTQLLPAARTMYGRRWRLQQDNDPKHTSRVAKDFLAENGVEVMNWPANSPDLNPIENLWQVIKNKVEKRMPENIEELKRFLAEEWDAVSEQTVINLISSMKNRCNQVLEKNGDRIEY
jgi:transposase